MNNKSHRLISLAIAAWMTISSNAQQSYQDRYADVLKHYAEHKGDSLKYKAALYLIDNMDGHMSPEGAAMDDYIRRVSTMKKSNGIRQLQAEWNNALKSGTITYTPDSTVISSSYLINNIESAFEAWEKAVWKDEITFSQFCEYILPYRASDEHLGDEWRKTLRQQYGSLIEGVTDIRKAFAIVKDSVFKAIVLSNDYCPYTLDPLTCHTIGRAECGQRCVMLVAVLRALGIPSTIDTTPMWADYSNKSHAWVAMVASNGDTYTVYEHDKEAKQFNPVDASQFLPRYKIRTEDHCPYTVKTTKTPVKIYRISFSHCNEHKDDIPALFASPFAMDVSAKYGLTTDVCIEVGDADKVYLCAYLSAAGWKSIAAVTPEDGKATFHDVGKGAVCTAATIRDGKRVFLSYPFLVGEKGIEKMYVPSKTRKQSICIDRKYPLCSYTTDTWGFMRGGTFEASMTKDFLTADTLAMITTMPYGMTTITLTPSKKYRYLRYHAPQNNRSSLAELQFYSADASGSQRLLKGTWFSDGVDSTMLSRTFDGNLSTICRGLQVGYTIGVDLGEDQEAIITKIAFCPSTDLNFVERDHLYELYYFDTEWHLIGRVYSKDYRLAFDNVPEGAILLLKDKSGGVEERIFEYVDEQQIWH